MPTTCTAITDIGSYSMKVVKTISPNDTYLYEEGGLMASRVDIVILSISGDVGVKDVVLSSRNYTDETENQYILTRWEKGLFTIACASSTGYFQVADMHFMNPTGTCTIEYVVKITAPSSVLEKRMTDGLNHVFSDYATFHPYYANVVECYVERIAIASFMINVVDKAGIVSQTTLNVQGALQNHETLYGMLYEIKKNGLFFISVGESVRLKVLSRLDTSSTALDYYPICTILTDRWFPTYNGLFKLEKTSGNINIPLVDNKEGFETEGKDIQFFYLFLKDLLPTSKTEVAESYIQDLFRNAINNGHRRIGIVFCPSTEGSNRNANSVTVDGISVFYHFPQWMLAELDAHASYKPYIFNRVDSYTSETIRMYNLDWRDQYTRNLYKDCIQRVVNYLKCPSSLLYGNILYDYIDVVNVAFSGTWGEGTTLNTSTYPSYENLLEISDYITNTLFPDKLCLRPLGSVLNSDFPEPYRSLILNPENPKRIGIFYDGIGVEPSDYFFTSVNAYTASNPTLMNRVYNYVRNHPCYLECALSDNVNNLPDYASICAYAKYFRPCYFNLHNISMENLLSQVNLQRVIRIASHYVGYRPYILINKCTLINSQEVQINVSIGNYGTAIFFQSFWKLRFYANACSESGNLEWEEMLNSSFDLSTIPAPFEVGVPNYHDTILWSYRWTMSHVVATGNRFSLLVAIEDTEGIISEPIKFCNDEESLPREYNGTTATGRYFLIQNLLY